MAGFRFSCDLMIVLEKLVKTTPLLFGICKCLLRQGGYLGETNKAKVIASNVFWLKFLVGSHLAMKNAISLIYRFKSIVQKNTLLNIKQKILESSPNLRVIGLKYSFSYNFYQCQNRMPFACILQPFAYLFPHLTHTDKTLITLHKP